MIVSSSTARCHWAWREFASEGAVGCRGEKHHAKEAGWVGLAGSGVGGGGSGGGTRRAEFMDTKQVFKLNIKSLVSCRGVCVCV